MSSPKLLPPEDIPGSYAEVDHPLNRYEMRILIQEELIQEKVRQLGEQISQDYQGRELTVIGALKGCFIFMADLVRNIHLPLTLDFLEVTSYGDSSVSSGIVKITKDFKYPLENRHILIVEDIIDTGLTLNFLVKNVLLRKPASVKIAALVVKYGRHHFEYPIDYRGFDIEDDFIVGYGMDYAGYYRNLNHIAILDEDRQLKLFGSTKE